MRQTAATTPDQVQPFQNPPWAAIISGWIISLLALALVLVWSAWNLHESFLSEITNRQGEILDSVTAAQFRNDQQNGQAAFSLKETTEQLQIALEVSHLREMLGVRLYSASGVQENAFPAYVADALLTQDDLNRLQKLQPASHYLGGARLDQQVMLPETSTAPLLLVAIPLRSDGNPNLVGILQFIMDGSSTAFEIKRLDEKLITRFSLAFLVASAILSAGLWLGFGRLQKSNRLLAERSRDLLQANRELALAAKSSALGAITAHLIHGLKNPLSGLQNFMQGASTAPQSGPGEWQEAAASAQRMQNLIHRVVGVLKEQDATSHYDISIGELLDLLTLRVGPLAKKHGVEWTVSNTATGSLPGRQAHLVLLILENLAQNAVEATPPGKKVQAQVFHRNESLVVRIEDQGHGLPPEASRNLFSPCASTKPNGSGLGLAITHQLARHLGAALELISSTTAGTCFELALNASPQPKALVESSPRLVSTLLLIAFLSLLPVLVPAQALPWRWSNPQPNGNNITGIAQNNGTSVEVAELGQIFVGTHFYDWSPVNSGTTNDLEAVTFFGNRLVAVGASGSVVYSDDDSHFTSETLNTSGNWLVALAASPNLLVADGDNATLVTSPDGANWSSQPTPPGVGANWLLSAAWGNDVFVIGGENGYLANSSDGIHWTNQASGVLGAGNDVTWLYYSTGSGAAAQFPYPGFWAVTDTGQAWCSTNQGVAWYRIQGVTGSGVLDALAVNASSALIAGATNAQFAGSSGEWSQQVGPQFTNAPSWNYYDCLWDTNGDYQLAGESGLLVQGAPTSTNITWQSQYFSIYDWLLQVVSVSSLASPGYTNQLYVAVGDHARIMTSSDGANWSVEAVPQTNSVSLSTSIFLGIGGDTNLLLAAGNQGCLAVSPYVQYPVVQTNLNGSLVTNPATAEGVLWYPLPAPCTNDLQAVGAFNGEYYLAGGNATLLASANGSNWVNIPLAVTNNLAGIAVSSNQMVIVGDHGCILTSPDGSTWTQQKSGTAKDLFRVRWINGQFLAMGQLGALLNSSNGIVWKNLSSGTTNWLNDAVMVSNTCFVVGDYGLVLSSTNMTNWSPSPMITRNSLYGAATQNGQLVVVGLSGSILRAQIIPNFSPVNIQNFVRAAGENVFLLSGQVDQSCTLNSSTNFSQWNTGPVVDFLNGNGLVEVIQSLPPDPPPAQFYRCELLQ